MTILKHFRHLGTIMLLAVVAILSSCSSDNSLKVVPDDVLFCARLNLENGLTRTGFNLTDTRFEMPGSLNHLTGSLPNEVVDNLTLAYRAFNLNGITVFGYVKVAETPEIYGVATIKDRNSAKEMLKEAGMEESEEEGFTVYSNPRVGMPIAIKDDFLWVTTATDAKSAVKSIKRVTDKASERSILDVKGVGKALEGDEIFIGTANLQPLMELYKRFGSQFVQPEMALAMSSITDKFSDAWAVGTFDVEGTVMDMKCRWLNHDGDEVEFPYGKEIDTDFLGYLSPDYYLSMAAGVDNEYIVRIIDAIRPMINDAMAYDPSLDKYYGPEYAQPQRAANEMQKKIVGSLLDMVKNIDGTVSVSAGATNLPDLIYGNKIDKLLCLATVSMKPGKATEALNVIAESLKTLIPAEAITATSKSMTIKIDTEVTWYAEVVGNDLLFSIRPIEKASGNPNLAKDMDDKNVALVAYIPSFRPLTNDKIDFGARVSWTATDKVADYRTELTDCNDNIVSAFIDLGMGLNAGYSTYRDKMRSSYSGFDSIVPVEETVEVVEVDSCAY